MIRFSCSSSAASYVYLIFPRSLNQLRKEKVTAVQYNVFISSEYTIDQVLSSLLVKYVTLPSILPKLILGRASPHSGEGRGTLRYIRYTKEVY